MVMHELQIEDTNLYPISEELQKIADAEGCMFEDVAKALCELAEEERNEKRI